MCRGFSECNPSYVGPNLGTIAMSGKSSFLVRCFAPNTNGALEQLVAGKRTVPREQTDDLTSCGKEVCIELKET
jgi:hypothetical protein